MRVQINGGVKKRNMTNEIGERSAIFEALAIGEKTFGFFAVILLVE
jgi:hypothetical protein